MLNWLIWLKLRGRMVLVSSSLCGMVCGVRKVVVWCLKEVGRVVGDRVIRVIVVG